MQLYEQIRRVRELEGLSIRALARGFGVHRREVRAALESAVPAPRKVAVRPSPKFGEFKPVIDGWLEADLKCRGSSATQPVGCGNAWLSSTALMWASQRPAGM